ncbi:MULTISPECIES: SPOR domain-containing protein [Legionella]|uniref:SPOR domain-containing protein n=1 Tax=Legionella septentrionalis TaxID=2498109 RepID=A0A3S1CL49_9GAMM|nr:MULTISPECIES: SPOR domain-containing protein [Legionella]MCP0913300.1 SPOR domain-containing protein [Legionella sp. 27cVA30]RUQ85200.1 SPOR domain-containing protein [Legionella septentrionalis]RUQ97978.1 SPOR domain-containing protein [Legionella septentrionalis]RUR08840.1 SPOR domain-containing protein [Legionella septentrionalis]RUR14658.1 SPOR domain-containing protein [Legionella septentrionalis]
MKFALDERLKHRLIGAVVIISVAAVFLPALMKQSNYRFDDKVSVSIRLPEKPTAPKVAVPDEHAMFQSVKVAHVDISNASEIARIPQTAKAEPLSIVPAASNRTPALAKADSFTKPAIAQVAKKPALLPVAKKEVVLKGVYGVQIASFTQKSNAQSLVERLRSKGYKASYSKFAGKNGDFYKVIVGQMKQKDEAINLQKQLAESMRLNGFIVKTGVS